MILDLPYKVKIVEKEKLNFSIIILNNINNEYNLPNILKKLVEFRDMGGEVYILNIDSTENVFNIAKEWGCAVEDGYSFRRLIDEEMCNVINDKFNMDDKENVKIVNINDTYVDYSSAKNYATTLTQNNMILMMNADSNIIHFNPIEINKSINIYNKLNFTSYNNDENIVFYDKTKFSWFNIILEKLIHFQSTSDNTNIQETIIPENILRIDSTIAKNEDIVALAVNCYMDNSNEELSQAFAKSLLNNNFLHSSYSEFNRHLSLTNSNVRKSETLVYIGDYFIKTERETEGLDYYHKAYLECSTRRTPLYKLGEYFYFKNEREKAIFYLEGCLNITKPENTNERDFIYKDGPYSMLYVAYWWIGKPEKGKYYFDKALEINPYNELYIEETIFHYEYKGNIIQGDLSFQEIQFLYEKSKNSKNILEILPNNGRSTHALINGCDGLITVIMENENKEFIENIQNPGNLRVIISPIQDAIKKLESEKQKFDLVYINDYVNIPDSDNLNRLNLEKLTNKIICGSKYNHLKEMIDQSFEISGCKENIWYKDISTFEKITIYKKKNIKDE